MCVISVGKLEGKLIPKKDIWANSISHLFFLIGGIIFASLQLPNMENVAFSHF